MPPASVISRLPAAMSQGDRPNSQKPSKRPAATYARSRAAAPGRRMPAVASVIFLNIRTYSSRWASWRNGKPVPISDSDSLPRRDTRIRRSSRKAPRPRVAVNSSLRVGSYTQACVIWPLCCKAIETAYCGKP